jgi:hypothetical protein
LGLKPVVAWQAAQAARAASEHQQGREQVSIQIFKRKGPPRLQPLLLNLPLVVVNDGRSIQETAQDLPLLRPAAFVNLASDERQASTTLTSVRAEPVEACVCCPALPFDKLRANGGGLRNVC